MLVCHLIEWVRSLSHRVTQKNRTHGVSQRPCGRQIAQNITPILSSNVLCILYAGGLLWNRNSAQMGSVKSVSSVREKTLQRVVCVLSHRVGAFYFSQIYTEEQNTQHSKQVVAPPPSPPPKGGA